MTHLCEVVQAYDRGRSKTVCSRFTASPGFTPRHHDAKIVKYIVKSCVLKIIGVQLLRSVLLRPLVSAISEPRSSHPLSLLLFDD